MALDTRTEGRTTYPMGTGVLEGYRASAQASLGSSRVQACVSNEGPGWLMGVG